MGRLADRRPVAHQKRMGARQHQVAGHAGHPRPLDGDLAIVRSGDEQTVDPIDGMAAGDHADGISHRTKPVGHRVGAGAELPAGGTVDRGEEPPGAKPVDDFAPLVRRTEHDDPAKGRQRMVGEIFAHEDAAERVGDEVNPGCAGPLASCDGGSDGPGGEFLDRRRARGIVNVVDDVAGRLQCVRHRLHRAARATESMKQNDVLGRCERTGAGGECEHKAKRPAEHGASEASGSGP